SLASAHCNGRKGVHRCEIIPVTNIAASQCSVACSKLQVTQPANFKEVFVANTPCTGNRWEISPLIVFAQPGSTVATDHGVQQVFTIIIVIQTSQVRNKICFLAVATCY